MVKDKTQINTLADVNLTFVLQIPQGNHVKLQVEQSHYNFYLNQKVVEQIQQAKKSGLSLYIPPKLLLQLWYCTFFQYNFVPEDFTKKIRQKTTKSYLAFLMNIFKIFRSKSLQDKTTLQTGCTFNSYYQQEKSSDNEYQEPDCVLQSIVLFHGDVIHKIQQNFLQNHANCSMIISAHYWLVNQLLGGLRNQLNVLIWELAALFPTVFVISKIYPVNIIHSINGVLLFIVCLLGATLLLAACRYLLFQQLQKLIAINYEYINWLAWGITCIIPAIAMSFTKDFNFINTILFLVISALAPLVMQHSLRLIWVQIIKLILRRVL
ncbi:hypothetical protein Nos7524_3328 [Nostoc sp. PCC 7524]|uniref:hypothetical protein n=1 Tax=Nostoc sp. (strain ATCC 29411 / PCC 7524) TaxID=28072 RepID=UPI00029EF8A3|nr:hypothetical protein [Nostoc sp. PCC 7524]AFY49124.1 hypothetical protein Nos7524_3328 [Nostoc sp. PCC 7524]